MKIFAQVAGVFSLALLIVVVFLLMNPTIVTNPSELTVRYEVQSYTTVSSHSYVYLTYIGRPENSFEDYTARAANSDTVVRQDAENGMCIYEENDIIGSVLHVPPDQGVCKTP